MIDTGSDVSFILFFGECNSDRTFIRLGWLSMPFCRDRWHILALSGANWNEVPQFIVNSFLWRSCPNIKSSFNSILVVEGIDIIRTFKIHANCGTTSICYIWTFLVKFPWPLTLFIHYNIIQWQCIFVKWINELKIRFNQYNNPTIFNHYHEKTSSSMLKN